MLRLLLMQVMSLLLWLVQLRQGLVVFLVFLLLLHPAWDRDAGPSNKLHSQHVSQRPTKTARTGMACRAAEHVAAALHAQLTPCQACSRCSHAG